MSTFYQYFGRYFYEEEVGDFWSIVNCLTACFWLGVGAMYLLKPWGLLSWNRTVVKNRVRLRKQKLDELDNELNNVDALVQGTRDLIVELNLQQLIDALQAGLYTAKQVVDAYRWKAMQVQKELNCVTEFVVEAPKMAEDLDSKYGNGEQKKPPLFGVPFSVKDNFWMVGYACSCGVAKQSEWPMKKECSFVSHLRSLGAVPIVRTNVPQTLMNYVCSNPLFGTTGNPFDKERTPGGSSGGECALLGAKGIPFAIGSDLAGSLRIPANFCGLVTLKPTASRFVVTAAHGGIPGICKLALSYGFFTHTTEQLDMLFKLTLTQSYFNRVPQTVPMIWGENSKPLPSILKIGYFVDDGFVKPVPSCVRAVLETKENLEKLGHELIPFKLPDPMLAVSLMFRSLFPDNGAYIKSQIEYEDVDAYLAQTFTIIKLPKFVKQFLSFVTQWKWPQLSVMSGAVVRDLSHLLETNSDVHDYTTQFTDYWRDLELDGLICPAFIVPPVPHAIPAKLPAAGFSTGLFNMLDFPAGVVPVTKVNESDEAELLSEYPTPQDAQLSPFSYLLKHPIYHMAREGSKGAKGLPIGVQVVTQPFHDEFCLKIMKLIEANVKK